MLGVIVPEGVLLGAARVELGLPGDVGVDPEDDDDVFVFVFVLDGLGDDLVGVGDGGGVEFVGAVFVGDGSGSPPPEGIGG